MLCETFTMISRAVTWQIDAFVSNWALDEHPITRTTAKKLDVINELTAGLKTFMGMNEAGNTGWTPMIIWEVAMRVELISNKLTCWLDREWTGIKLFRMDQISIWSDIQRLCSDWTNITSEVDMDIVESGSKSKHTLNSMERPHMPYSSILR